MKIEIEVKDYGTIQAELYPESAPITVANFVKLAEDHFFDGLIFHRIIKGFMIQGGGYDENLNSHRAETIKGEFASNGVKNDLKHTRGVLSMARTSIKDSASSQFFIMHEDAPHLDGEYAAFGKVTDGIDVVDKIASVKTDGQDAPFENVVISAIRVL
jgi:peptidyl-prolyl cis-trans isomerase B (cyclophilin B)